MNWYVNRLSGEARCLLEKVALKRSKGGRREGGRERRGRGGLIIHLKGFKFQNLEAEHSQAWKGFWICIYLINIGIYKDYEKKQWNFVRKIWKWGETKKKRHNWNVCVAHKLATLCTKCFVCFSQYQFEPEL